MPEQVNSEIAKTLPVLDSDTPSFADLLNSSRPLSDELHQSTASNFSEKPKNEEKIATREKKKNKERSVQEKYLRAILSLMMIAGTYFVAKESTDSDTSRPPRTQYITEQLATFSQDVELTLSEFSSGVEDANIISPVERMHQTIEEIDAITRFSASSIGEAQEIFTQIKNKFSQLELDYQLYIESLENHLEKIDVIVAFLQDNQTDLDSEIISILDQVSLLRTALTNKIHQSDENYQKVLLSLNIIQASLSQDNLTAINYNTNDFFLDLLALDSLGSISQSEVTFVSEELSIIDQSLNVIKAIQSLKESEKYLDITKIVLLTGLLLNLLSQLRSLNQDLKLRKKDLRDARAQHRNQLDQDSFSARLRNKLSSDDESIGSDIYEDNIDVNSKKQ